MLGAIVQQIDTNAELLLNTQTHLLLAAALLCRPSKTGPKLSTRAAGTNSSVKCVNLAVLIGALLPDISLFIMWGQAKARGIADAVIWQELYFSAFWQKIGAITNSIPLYVFIAVVAIMLGGRIFRCQSGTINTKLFGQVFLFLSAAALIHCLTDLPLHVDDGHAHFWPFSNWIFASPVSYWDSNHYAHYWQPIEILIALVCVVSIYRRFSSVWVRVIAIASLLSYAVLIVFWTYTMG